MLIKAYFLFIRFQYVCMKSNVTTRGPGPSCFYVDGRVRSFSGWTHVRAAVVLQDVVDGSETFRAIQGFCLTCSKRKFVNTPIFL